MGNLLQIDAVDAGLIGTILVKITRNLTALRQNLGTPNVPCGTRQGKLAIWLRKALC